MTLMKTIKDFLNNQIFIGIDDSDSKIGGCTTFVGYLLIKELIRQGINVVDIPRLIRLNPNVPWKTRGNGAVGITVYSEDIDRVYNVAVEILQKIEEEVASMPALVLIDQKQREFIEPIIKDAINRIIEPELVDKVIEKAKIIKYAKRRLGLVGALAAATLLLLEGDYTYELLAYRKPEFIGTKRKIDIESVRVIDRLYRKYTFNNIDGKRLLLTPHGKDPVLYGIRGEDPKKLIEAKKFIVSEEPLGWMVYITNQATDQHYVNRKISELKLGDSVRLNVFVKSSPKIRQGCVTLEVGDHEYTLTALFFNEVGLMKDIATKLEPQDEIIIMGGVRPFLDFGINVEKLIVKKLAKKIITLNPACPRCKRTLQNEGKGKFRCRFCDLKGLSLPKRTFFVSREIVPGLYLPPIRYFRHLMKPLKRYGKEKNGRNYSLNEYKMIE
ncbi:hypothetical protein B9Q02_00160 [Candidatus Marsarchaeota G1 archaeon BE_D]|jgi:Predicted DNA-binding protein containing a Zn-ribbon domain|uniref:tRNA(Ile2) 2-agmatinylcytidine synthetase TiaS n=1 Tax=Candidatus Marsarchaeota G1 archaeon BE_D TaxID=1978156 RepID=A0A2R6AKH2_9ARCH|nr:MAG: hypothetical protein B9Q02_00160 [Candidatus Marsarchaeota G1 archaeon BE_D]